MDNEILHQTRLISVQLRTMKLSIKTFEFVSMDFYMPGQIPLQFAAIERDVAANGNVDSFCKENVSQPSKEVKLPSREQVIENNLFCLFPHYILWLPVLTF